MRRSVLKSTATIVVVLVLGLLGAPSASADDQPQVPHQVSDYFANGLIPRLIDLYGSGDGVTAGTDFDATTTVGRISRVFEWTPDFLAGKHGDAPTRFTNNWVASVSVRGAFLGLATVWINPASDLPELSSFDSPELAMRLSSAPAKSSLVHDTARQAWFLVNGNSLTPLVAGTSRVTGTTTTDAYQLSISSAQPPQSSGFSGVAISALVLGVVILGLAVFVLLPVGRRGEKGKPEGAEDGDTDEADDTDDADDSEDTDDTDDTGKATNTVGVDKTDATGKPGTTGKTVKAANVADTVKVDTTVKAAAPGTTRKTGTTRKVGKPDDS